jgi:hypothetical protein
MIRRATAVLFLATLISGCAATGPTKAGGEVNAMASTADATVRIMFDIRYYDGEGPSGTDERSWPWGSAAHEATKALEEERSFEMPGWLIADDLVICEDPMIEDRFVDHISVDVDGKLYTAKPDRYSTRDRALILRLESPAENASPLVFDGRAEGPYFIAIPGNPTQGLYIIKSGLGEIRLIFKDDAPRNFSRTSGPVINDEGVVAGIILSEEAMTPEQWKTPPLERASVSHEELAGSLEKIERVAAAGLLGVEIKFRTKASRRVDLYYGNNEDVNEIQAPGVVVSPDTVLVLASLDRRETSRIESMTANCGDEEVELSVRGAFREYGIIVASPVGGPANISPVELSDVEPADALEHLLVADALSFDQFARDERFMRGRIDNVESGFKGLRWPTTFGSKPGSFLFDLEGRLCCLPVERRPDLTLHGWRRYDDDLHLLMPAARMAALLADPDANVRADFVPLSEDEGKRLVWLGVETQDLDPDLARVKQASLATRGGSTGAFVTHVYPESPADIAGIKSGDILLRFNLPDQARPVNVSLGQRASQAFPWARLDEVPDVYFEQIPLPWPGRENPLTRFLTEVGAEATLTLEALRKGEPIVFEIATANAPDDFASAARHKHKELGLTVKEITYEVRRYFQLANDDPGVIIAGIEAGSKASVAGLKPFEIVTAVNGAPVVTVGEFEAAMPPGGDVALTVKRMFQSRVVQVKTTPAEPEKADEEEAQADTNAVDVKEPADESAPENAAEGS